MARSAPPATAPDVLTNGRYALLLTARGGGYAAFDGFALTRWSPDPLGSTGGLYVYLRDLADGRVWSIAAEPVPAPADDRSFERTAHGALWRRRDAHIVASMDAGVAADHDLELRRITLHNAGGDQRAIEVTTYAEVALDRPAALAAHPAFSNLFVQTGVEPALEALLAWRRLRSPDDVPLWLIHRLVVAEGAAGDADWETDRARFIGRGRTLAAPAALDGAAALSGTVGNVLDPVVSLRRVVSLPPGGSATLVAALGAGRTHDDVLALGRAVEDGSARERMLAQRAGRGSADDATLGMPAAWRESLEILPASGDGDDAPAAARRPAAFAGGAVSSDEELLCFNGHGGFTRDGTEYVVRIEPGALDGALPPQPWVNVIANESAGVIASERGALHTWTANSRENRLTPWYNDPVRDPHGEAFYIRDEEAGDVWSPTPGPMPAAASRGTNTVVSCSRPCAPVR